MPAGDSHPCVARGDNDLVFGMSGTKGFVTLTPEVKGHLKTERILSFLFCCPWVQLLISSFLSLCLEKTSHILSPYALKTKLARGMSKETQG